MAAVGTRVCYRVDAIRPQTRPDNRTCSSITG